MARKEETNWITSAAAAAILTERSGHTVSAAYVRGLGMAGKLGFRAIDGRTKLYSQADVEAYTVKPRGDGSIRRVARAPRRPDGWTPTSVPKLSTHVDKPPGEVTEMLPAPSL